METMQRLLNVLTASLVVLCGCGHGNLTVPQFDSIHPDGNHLRLPDNSPKHFSVLHSFHGWPGDGSNPIGGLVQDAAGNLYGTTDGGGASQDGAIFKVDASGNETLLHSFDVVDGLGPQAGLVWDGAGNLYGTTALGGNRHNVAGVVFELDTSDHETVVHSFGGRDGNDLRAGLIRDSAGNMYGTSYLGGSSQNCFNGCGVVFKIDSSGNESVLHSFNGTDGKYPIAGLVQDSAGNLYGTTLDGGIPACYDGCGEVFKVKPNGDFSVLHRFNGRDGGYPQAGLVLDSLGNLYGATVRGGPPVAARGGLGVIFKLSPNGNETVLHSFNGLDGSFPFVSLIRDSAGNLYGTATEGGSGLCTRFGCGVVFKINPQGVETVLHNFHGTDGNSPDAQLFRDSAGNLYGTTAAGGSLNLGVVIKLSP
jgi:uncharacterized repeat protein (TIGR03803 family)